MSQAPPDTVTETFPVVNGVPLRLDLSPEALRQHFDDDAAIVRMDDATLRQVGYDLLSRDSFYDELDSFLRDSVYRVTRHSYGFDDPDPDRPDHYHNHSPDTPLPTETEMARPQAPPISGQYVATVPVNSSGYTTGGATRYGIHVTQGEVEAYSIMFNSMVLLNRAIQTSPHGMLGLVSHASFQVVDPRHPGFREPFNGDPSMPQDVRIDSQLLSALGSGFNNYDRRNPDFDGDDDYE